MANKSERPYYSRLWILVSEVPAPSLQLIRNRTLRHYEISQDEKVVYRYLSEAEHFKRVETHNWEMEEIGLAGDLDLSY